MRAFLRSIVLALSLVLVSLPALAGREVEQGRKGNVSNAWYVESTAEFYLKIARGLVPGHKVIVIPGRQDAISTTLLDDISQIPATIVLPNPGGIRLEVVSSSGNDDAVGTGAQTVDVHGLDAAGNEIDENVIMDGTNPVDTVRTDWDRIQWMHVRTLGTGINKTALGNISLRNTAGTETYEYIVAGGNQSLSARYHIPAGKTGYVLGWAKSAITKAIDFRLRITADRTTGELLPGVFLFRDAGVLDLSASGYIPFDIPLMVPSGATVKVSAISSAAGGDGGTSLMILLIDDGA